MPSITAKGVSRFAPWSIEMAWGWLTGFAISQCSCCQLALERYAAALPAALQRRKRPLRPELRPCTACSVSDLDMSPDAAILQLIIREQLLSFHSTDQCLHVPCAHMLHTSSLILPSRQFSLLLAAQPARHGRMAIECNLRILDASGCQLVARFAVRGLCAQRQSASVNARSRISGPGLDKTDPSGTFGLRTRCQWVSAQVSTVAASR